MSTNIDPLTGDVFPPDQATDENLTVDPLDDLNIPSVVPIFDDSLFDDVAVDTYDEYASVLSLVADTPPDVVPIGRTWAFDFNTGEFEMAIGGSPKKLQDDDVRILQQWIRRALTTERLAYILYPANFGVELAPVLSGALRGPAGAIHIISTVKDALLVHDRIVSVTDVKVTEEDSTISISANVHMDRGELFATTVPLGGI